MASRTSSSKDTNRLHAKPPGSPPAPAAPPALLGWRGEKEPPRTHAMFTASFHRSRIQSSAIEQFSVVENTPPAPPASRRRTGGGTCSPRATSRRQVRRALRQKSAAVIQTESLVGLQVARSVDDQDLRASLALLLAAVLRVQVLLPAALDDRPSVVQFADPRAVVVADDDPSLPVPVEDLSKAGVIIAE